MKAVVGNCGGFGWCGQAPTMPSGRQTLTAIPFLYWHIFMWCPSLSVLYFSLPSPPETESHGKVLTRHISALSKERISLACTLEDTPKYRNKETRGQRYCLCLANECNKTKEKGFVASTHRPVCFLAGRAFPIRIVHLVYRQNAYFGKKLFIVSFKQNNWILDETYSFGIKIIAANYMIKQYG